MLTEKSPVGIGVRKHEILSEIRNSTEDEIASKIQTYEEKIALLEKVSITDALTELLNRSGLDLAWKRIMDHLRRHPDEDPGVMVLLDLNDFKKANDVYGHAAGDAVLVEFSKVIQDLTRQEDTRGRMGGDEFELHLDGASIEQAELVLERINQGLMDRTKHLFSGTPVVTVSRGIVKVDPNCSLEELRKSSDQEMYKHKEMMHSATKSKDENEKVENSELMENLGFK